MKRIKNKKNMILHVYNRGNRKEEICLDRKDYIFLYNLFSYHFQQNNFDLLSFCILPNHYHLLAVQKGNVDIAVPMQGIAARYTKYFNKKYGYCGHLFQGPYQCKTIHNIYQLQIASNYLNSNLPKTKRSYPYLYFNQTITHFYILNFHLASL
jgi:REP element-mobilizing transposase RayT